jgi:meiotically up-regulated gene 157 (Mug157) protein
MEWIEKFKKAISPNLHLATAILLAEVIHHLTIIKKQNTVNINRKILKDFGVNYHRTKPYLQCFEKASLIELSIKNRSMTQIKLLLPDPYQYVPNYKKNKERTFKGTKGTMSERTQLQPTIFEGPKEPAKESPKELRKQGRKGQKKQGTKGGRVHD